MHGTKKQKAIKARKQIVKMLGEQGCEVEDRPNSPGLAGKTRRWVEVRRDGKTVTLLTHEDGEGYKVCGCGPNLESGVYEWTEVTTTHVAELILQRLT
jgi:hypothetical protein